jgi:DNA polymerase I-like protein with 3'-5' exonuclease and polymerase domains
MPVALAWKKEQYARAVSDGYVQTVFGRRRHFPLVVPENYEEVRKSCVHMVIASTASDLTLMALTRLEKEGIPVVLSVHDSILAEVKDSEAEQAGVLMQSAMVDMGNKYLPDVPWKVDAEIRQRWSGGRHSELIDGEWIENGTD